MFGDEVNITLEGRRHLGAVIGSKEFKDQYCQEKVDKWFRELESLAEISKSQPHAAYVAFTKGFKSKFTYYLRTIESFEEYVDPIEEVIHTSFLPSLFGRAEPLPEELKELVCLSPARKFRASQCLARYNGTTRQFYCYSKLHHSSTGADGGKEV